ncbi:hypothetical protein DKG77_07430 [Flagellimonas aquimarina]|jgi:hypothetical protein|uniref:Uncharacterized protein n=1 Tax=Flagellimonas aquimarina TaxID=2201895 RepID=A0A316KWT9_9FLAO|nr:hypothetical protein [Allomuricauda koreensis]PWL38116.1 hypothetical protein DKG77_07430 [Allomuricauda koreensis]
METVTKEFKKLDWGKALLRVLELLIIKPFTLPIKIYINALKNLSNAKSENGEVHQLSDEFPLYVWLISIFDALIFLAYPIGIVMAIRGANSYFGGFGLFMGILGITYFLPLYLSLIRELAQISLKILLYLKLIASKK